MFTNYLFRCHSIGKLMTEPKLKADKEAGNLSETAKTHLLEIYIAEKYGRKKDISNKYITKGLMAEDDSIKLYSTIKLEKYVKNELRLKNEYLVGTPDIIDTEVIDVKTSWDIFTFFAVAKKEINSDYFYQLQAYLALTGLTVSKLAYCLVNTPQTLINDEKRKLMYKMNVATDEAPEYVKACEDLERSMTYDDIPLSNRIIEFQIDRDDKAILRMYDKITRARQYLNDLDL